MYKGWCEWCLCKEKVINDFIKYFNIVFVDGMILFENKCY